MWLILMTASNQWLIGLVVPTVISIAVGYGGFQFGYGKIEQKVTENSNDIKSMMPLASKIPVLENEIENQNQRLDAFERLVISNQKEQRDIANKILDKMTDVSKSSLVNSTKIGAIEVSVSEIEKRLR